MKIKLKFVLIFTLFFLGQPTHSFSQQTNAYSQKTFFNSVLCGRFSHRAYISVEVESVDYVGRAVISNEALFTYFYKKKGLNEKQYRDYMKMVLTDKIKIHLEKDDFAKWYFRKAKTIDNVENDALKGREKFLTQYFETNGVIKKNITKDEQNAVIGKLFEWEIVTLNDDETGLLVFYVPQTETKLITLTGVVYASSGAIMPGTEVSTVTSEGKIIQVRTNDNGIYELKLTPGKYDLEFNLRPLRTLKILNFTVVNSTYDKMNLDVVITNDKCDVYEMSN